MFISRKRIVIHFSFLAIIFVTVAGIIGCKGENMQNELISNSLIKNVSEDKWSSLTQKRIYFGHQSVGFNIVDGLNVIVEENPKIKLNILKAGEPVSQHDFYFAHSQVGKNRDPISKINDFSQTLHNDIGDKANIAFLKFCYVDITKNTDIDNLFEKYKKELSSLKETYPDTKFVHVTAPLKTVQTGIKAIVKNVIGKPAGGYESNIMRNNFNKLIYQEYSGKEPIFDLARIEATQPDGSLQSFSYEGKEYISLYPKYTNDGGHLNNNGQRVVAESLLLLLADLK